MSLTRYRFSTAVNAFFEMPTDNARRLLPRHLQPLELHHGSGVFAVTAFDFTESMVGPYTEIVLAVIVPPLVEEGGAFPKSAFYPYMVATSTEAARLHAIERWHLPHHMADVQVDFRGGGNHSKVHVREGDTPILDLEIRAHEWEPVDHLYQCFMADKQGRYKADIHMEGFFTEHEEETGSLKLHPHAMTEGLDIDGISTWPFRELWMKSGVQTFEPLEEL